ncbi:MAG: hypothetical protein ABW252_14145 [Polyangiales bacterium]
MHRASLHTFLPAFSFLLLASSCAPLDDDAYERDLDDDALQQVAAAPAASSALPFERTYRIPLRVHRGDSGLAPQALASVLEEVNEIWLRQAAVCFEVEIVTSDAKRADGFDLWFHRARLGCNTRANGVYCGDHDIHVLDRPSLNPASSPRWDTRQDVARTSAHELGHGLSLQHYNGQPDSNDSLMSSGRQGFKLSASEVMQARRRAAQKALADGTPRTCAPIPVVTDAP